jgi:hypothetical protein
MPLDSRVLGLNNISLPEKIHKVEKRKDLFPTDTLSKTGATAQPKKKPYPGPIFFLEKIVQLLRCALEGHLINYGAPIVPIS